MLLEELRNSAFWLLDLLGGGTIRGVYEEIKRVDSLDSTSAELKEYREAKLEDLLEHVRKTVPYYQKMLELKELNDFPVINKNIMKDTPESFLSSAYSLEQLEQRSTSGSTGIPFSFYQDHKKRKHVNAEIVYYFQKTGYKIGYPVIYLRNRLWKGKFQQLLQNQRMFLCTDLSDTGIEKILLQIKNASTSKYTVVLAFASTLNAFNDYFSRKGFQSTEGIHLSGVVSIAEILLEDTRAGMEKAFQCPCVSRYSNGEFGVMGQDCQNNNEFLINEASYVIEILEMDQDIPAVEGQIGRIVVTDLYNYGMPFIRYDTGDLGRIELREIQGIKKNAICEFGGRRMDSIFDSYGKRISPHHVAGVLRRVPGMRQYQFIQSAPTNYVLKLNAVETQQMTETVMKLLMEILGEHAYVTIDYVDEIPVLSSGKRKYIVNEMLS